MVRSFWAAVRAAAVISILLGGAAGALSAQQAQRMHSRAPAAAQETKIGPQIASLWPRYDAPDVVRPLRAAAADLNDQHTVILSTLSLILIGIIVVLLVTK